MDDLNNNITTLNALFREQTDNPLSGSDDSNTSRRMSAENMQVRNFQIEFYRSKLRRVNNYYNNKKLEKMLKNINQLKCIVVVLYPQQMEAHRRYF